MDANTLDFNTITVLVAIAGSWLTTFSTMIRQSNRHEDSIKALDTKVTGDIKALDTKVTGDIKALDTKVTGDIKALDTKVTGRIDRLDDNITDIGQRLARVEGHLMAPEGFTVRHPRQPEPNDRPNDDSATDQREAS